MHCEDIEVEYMILACENSITTEDKTCTCITLKWQNNVWL